MIKNYNVATAMALAWGLLAAPAVALAQEPAEPAPPAAADPEAESAPAAATEVAQAPEANSTAAAERNDIDEIIVTATRREARLSDVPQSISAVSQDVLKNSGTNDIKELTQISPSLLITSTGSEANTAARIRGIGTIGDNPGLESSVAVFVDGVLRSRTGTAMSELGDVERVEVMRGPQGTLFGRNASAGLIHLITQKPSFDASSQFEVDYGNYDYWRARASTTGAITSNLAGKIEGTLSKRDGFYEDVNTGYEPNDRDRYVLRGQLLFVPTDDLSVRFIVDYARSKTECCGAVYATDDVSKGASQFLDPANNPRLLVMQEVAGGASLDTLFPARNDAYSRKIAISPGRDYAGKATDKGVSAEVNWAANFADLTSITAFRSAQFAQNSDLDYGLLDILRTFQDDGGRRFETFSQEVRLNGVAFNDRLDWLVGAYYSREDLRLRSSLGFGNDYGAFASCILAQAVSPAIMDATQSGCLSPTGRAVVGGALGAGTLQAYDLLYTVNDMGDNVSEYDQDSNSFALFTHNIFHLTQSIDVTVGLRYTTEKKKFSADFNNDNVVCPQMKGLAPQIAPTLVGSFVTLACQGNSSSELNALNFASDFTHDELTGTVALSWKPTERWMVYGSFATGYKAGGYNLDRAGFGPSTSVLTEGAVANLKFDPETVDAYEVGAKYGTRMFSAALSLFRQEFENFQLNTFDGTTYIVETINGCSRNLNGGDRDADPATGACTGKTKAGVISEGLELEGLFRPLRTVALSAGWTYADTRYANQLVGDSSGSPLSPSLRRLPGQQVSNSPKRTLTASLAWTPTIGSSGLSGLLYLNSRTVSKYNTGSNLDPAKVQDGFTLVNARLGLLGAEDRWAVEVWAENLFDKDYAQVVFDSAFQNSFSAYLADPRTVGMTVRLKF